MVEVSEAYAHLIGLKSSEFHWKKFNWTVAYEIILILIYEFRELFDFNNLLGINLDKHI